MFDEEELLPISALQHFVFCPRRCALVHIEQVWTENKFTVEGDLLHERVDELGRESRPTLIVSHGVGIRSLRFGVTGKVDVVEFRLSSQGQGGMRACGPDGNLDSPPYRVQTRYGATGLWRRRPDLRAGSLSGGNAGMLCSGGFDLLRINPKTA